MNLIKTIIDSIRHVEFVKYAYALVGIAAAIVLINNYGIDNVKFPTLPILICIALMVVVAICARSIKNKKAEEAGVFLIYFIVIATVVVSTMIITSIFFNCPLKSHVFIGTAIGAKSADSASSDTCFYLDVLSVHHGSGSVGEYFNFDKSQVDLYLGRDTWKTALLPVVIENDGKKTRDVIVWGYTTSAGGDRAGDAHGQWKYGAKENDWADNDRICLSKRKRR